MTSDRFGDFEASERGMRQYFSSFAFRGVNASIVLSNSGDYLDENGESALLSSPLDRVWLSLLRGGAHAIVTTGATVRAERIRQTSVPLVVASKSGDLTGLRPDPGAQLYVASDVLWHDSWPEHAKPLGKFADLNAVIGYAGARWKDVQVELGLKQLIAAYQSGQINHVFVSAPSAQKPSAAFGALTELCRFDNLVLFTTR